MTQKPPANRAGEETPDAEPGERISGEYRMTYREVARITTVRRSVPAKSRVSDPALPKVDVPDDES